MKLSDRLLMVASFVRKGSSVADIGTDHAYLPTWLILNGVCEDCVAADIGKGPLLNAKKTVEEYGLEDNIKLVLSDGLKGIDLETIDTLVLAGMGGDLIVDILSGADARIIKKMHIIAQPQSHAEKVRCFFVSNGFKIESESICRDSKHIYICMDAVFYGEYEKPDFYEFYGELVDNDDKLVKEYFDKQIFCLDKKRDALLKSGKCREAERLEKIISEISVKIGEKKNES